MPEDKWHMPFFHASKTNGFFYQQSSDVTNDTNFDGEGDVSDSGGGEWQFNLSGDTSVRVFKHRDFLNSNSIGGCDMNFEDTADRGYAYKADSPRDIELKLLMKFETNLGDSGLSLSGPTGRHSGDGCCSGFAYMINANYNDNPCKFRFRKEMWHVSYHTHSSGEWTHPKVNFKLKGHGWVGYGYCRYNKKDGVSAGHDSVILECWFNPNPDTDIKNWIMLKRIEDKGGWGNDGDDCNGASDQVGVWSNGAFRIKGGDDGTIRCKNLSLREIDPTKSFDDDPTAPLPPGEDGSGGGEITTSIITGTFRFNQDINTIRISPCAGTGSGSAPASGGSGGGSSETEEVEETPEEPGGGTPEETGSAKFYQVATTSHTTELSNTATFQNRTRGGEQCANSSSPMKAKVLKQLDVWLRKVGSPSASPKIFAKIWSSSGATRYTSPTQIDPSTLSTSYTKKIFDFSANTLSINTGDVVGVNYDTGSDTNYVEFAYHDNVVANCVYVNYESGVWEPKPTTRDFTAQMWD